MRETGLQSGLPFQLILYTYHCNMFGNALRAVLLMFCNWWWPDFAPTWLDILNTYHCKSLLNVFLIYFVLLQFGKLVNKTNNSSSDDDDDYNLPLDADIFDHNQELTELMEEEELARQLGDSDWYVTEEVDTRDGVSGGEEVSDLEEDELPTPTRPKERHVKPSQPAATPSAATPRAASASTSSQKEPSQPAPPRTQRLVTFSDLITVEEDPLPGTSTGGATCKASVHVYFLKHENWVSWPGFSWSLLWDEEPC